MDGILGLEMDGCCLTGQPKLPILTIPAYSPPPRGQPALVKDYGTTTADRVAGSVIAGLGG